MVKDVCINGTVTICQRALISRSRDTSSPAVCVWLDFNEAYDRPSLLITEMKEYSRMSLCHNLVFNRCSGISERSVFSQGDLWSCGGRFIMVHSYQRIVSGSVTRQSCGPLWMCATEINILYQKGNKGLNIWKVGRQKKKNAARSVGLGVIHIL